jgi:hypothetical protein
MRLPPVLLLGILFLSQAALSQIVPTKEASLFRHDSGSWPESAPGTSENRITYLDHSGVRLLTDGTALEYVLSSEGYPLLNRPERQGSSNGYDLKLSIFNLDQKEPVAVKDISLPGKSFRVFQTASGKVVVVSESQIVTISPTLEILQQVPLESHFRGGQIWSATDLNGAHLYLIGNSTEQCPTLVQILDSDSLLPTGSWCLSGDSARAFFGDTSVEYNKGKNSTVSVYQEGKQANRFDLPKLPFIEQVVLLSDHSLIAVDGANLLSYTVGRGIAYYVPVLHRYNIDFPITCDVVGRACAFVLVKPASDFFDVRSKTTFKDVAVAVVDVGNGKIRFLSSIRGRFKNVSDVHVSISPGGNRVAIWFGSFWEVYPVR